MNEEEKQSENEESIKINTAANPAAKEHGRLPRFFSILERQAHQRGTLARMSNLTKLRSCSGSM